MAQAWNLDVRIETRNDLLSSAAESLTKAHLHHCFNINTRNSCSELQSNSALQLPANGNDTKRHVIAAARQPCAS